MGELVAPVTGCPSGELRFALLVTFSPESSVSGAATPHLCRQGWTRFAGACGPDAAQDLEL